MVDTSSAEVRTALDRFGLEVTTCVPACLQAINEYYDAVLAYRPFSAWTIAETAVQHDCQCPLARLLAADYAFCSGNADRFKSLMHELIATPGEVLESWTWRERRYVEAWRRWTLASDPAGCYDALQEVVIKHPSDLFAVKRGHIMGLILGDCTKIMDIVSNAAEAASSIPPPKFLHGMWAFGLEQTGRYEEAEAKAREGLEFESQLGPDAWLDHGMAHALYFQGEDRMDDALEFLQSRCGNWSADALHPFLYTHLWWHTALLHCERREFPDALRIFDERLWADANAAMRGDPQVQLNALNLLWRFETRGQHADARPRWAAVIQGCKGTTLPQSWSQGAAPLQHSDLLLDILLVRAFCVGARDEAASLDAWLAAIQLRAVELAKHTGGGDRAEAYAAIAIIVAELYRDDQKDGGLAARHSNARLELKDLQPKWSRLGGSEEQRSILLEALDDHPVVCGQPEVNYDTLFM